MIHHIVLFKLKPDADAARIEWMMRETRIQLLKIPEVLSVRCGKRLEASQDWPFFLAVECESPEKVALYLEHPIHIKYREEVILPHITERLALDFEMEPARRIPPA